MPLPYAAERHLIQARRHLEACTSATRAAYDLTNATARTPDALAACAGDLECLRDILESLTIARRDLLDQCSQTAYPRHSAE